MKTDTIAAIATAMTSSGIGIIRISGGQAFEVIEKIFKKKNGGKIDLSRSHTVQYGYICDQDEVIDEVLVQMCIRDSHLTSRLSGMSVS